MTTPHERFAALQIGSDHGIGKWISDDTIETAESPAMFVEIGHVIQVDGSTWAVLGRTIDMTSKPGGVPGQINVKVTLRLAARE